MEVRTIRPDECELLGRITIRAYRNLQGGLALGPYEDVLVDVAARTVDCEVFVALDADGELIGGVTYVPGPGTGWSEFTDPDAAGIRMLAVDPPHEGAGAGRALVEACIARARIQLRRRVVLHSTPVMEVARALYERLGFVTTPELDAWVTDEPYSVDEPLHLIAYGLSL